ncbi:RING/FYVE/PHD zinc finger superfamily protein [Euphorbia peplus]|nr:RING/FYVE/PHD zinc finger superfamily protein [Euphorbia peplus]
MVDDFMVCIDRIIASACFDSVHAEKRDKEKDIESLISVNINEEKEGSSCFNEMVECRICQEEDDVFSMEAPCACNGTLKFAHRKCIQRWCNKKGDVTCEICNQVFSPNYSVPPARSNPDVMAIDIRQAWRQHIDLRESHLLALAAAEIQSDYEDFAMANTSSIACLRSIALILLALLLLSQALLITRDAMMVQEPSSLYNFQISVLRFAGFLLPCYVMARSWYIVQTRRRQA